MRKKDERQTTCPGDPRVRARAVNSVQQLTENGFEDWRGEGLASAAARTIIGILSTAAPFGARRPPPYITVRT